MPNKHKTKKQFIDELHALRERITQLEKLEEERERIQKMLKESEDMYKILVTTSPDAVTITNLEGEITEVSQRTLHLHGFDTPEELLGKNALELIAPFDHEKARDNIMKTLKEGSVRNVEYTLLKKDGTSFFGELNASVVLDSSGKPKAFIGITRDITERKKIEEVLQQAQKELEKQVEHCTADLEATGKRLQQQIMGRRRAEDALQESKAQFRRIVDLSPFAISILNALGHYLYINKKFTDLFGYTLEDIPTGKEWFNLAFPDTEYRQKAKSFWKSDITKLKQGAVKPRTFKIRCKDSTFRDVILRPIAMEDDQWFLIYEDITERRHAEEEKEQLESHLRQTQKMEAIGTLAGGIAHDFNNILSIILGYTELAIENAGKKSQAQSPMRGIIKACTRGKDLVRQILTFSSDVDQERKPIKIKPIIEDALGFIRASLPSTIEIRQKIDRDCGVIMANPTQIHQIIINLCSNAYHAMGESGGTLHLQLTMIDVDSHSKWSDLHLTEGKYLKLTVTDTGHGIEKADLERIFDPFFTKKPPGKGTGLGLSIVHGIVKSHEGVISVKSELNKGTSFSIYLPCINQVTATKELKKSTISKGNEHVLFIDDEESIIEATKILLERLNYKVTTLKSSSEALSMFHKTPDKFDIVITDQTMPTMTGIELAGKLMLIRPNIPIILTTGYNEAITKEKAKKIGICECIIKPFLPSDLARAIRRIMDERYTV
ncbi:MAG: PAS domain S-box protein [bacterium]